MYTLYTKSYNTCQCVVCIECIQRNVVKFRLSLKYFIQIHRQFLFAFSLFWRHFFRLWNEQSKYMVRTEKKKSRTYTQTNEKKSHWIDSFPLSWLSAMIAMFPHKNWSTFNSWCEKRKSNSAYVYEKYIKKKRWFI